MDLHIINFKDLTTKQINKYLNQIKTHNLYHSPSVITYQLSTKLWL